MKTSIPLPVSWVLRLRRIRLGRKISPLPLSSGTKKPIFIQKSTKVFGVFYVLGNASSELGICLKEPFKMV
jgi:hypothetical protein